MPIQSKKPPPPPGFVSGNSILRTLNENSLEKLNLTAEKHSYKKKEIIFREGNRPSGLYCIMSGKVKITKTGEAGRDQITRLASDGDFIGYKALISSRPYSATATALEDCTLCHIGAVPFFSFLKENPDFSMELMKLIAEEIGNADLKFVEYAQKPMQERVAEGVYLLSKTFGFDDEGYIDVSLTREEMGSYIGTTTETAIRYLANFKKQNILTFKGRYIKIIDPDRLMQIAFPDTPAEYFT